MKLIAGLMVAGVLAGVAAPAYAGSAAPSATPLGDTISIELSPEYGATSPNAYKDTYAKIGFSHSLGQGFSWGAAVQDTVSPTAGKSSWQGETTLGYKWKQDAFTFGVSGGVGYNAGYISGTTPVAGYYLVSGTIDWKLSSKWTWNVINARYRNAFDYAWETPKIATGVTYTIDPRQAVYVAVGYAWKNSVADKENVAVGYKIGF